MAWASFITAPALVSTGGSFSFIPGVTLGKRFITPDLSFGTCQRPPEDGKGWKEDLAGAAPWIYFTGPAISHSEVEDYFNFDYKQAGR